MEAVHDPTGKPGPSPTTRPVEVRQLEGIVSRLRFADGLFADGLTTFLDVPLAVDVREAHVTDEATLEYVSGAVPVGIDCVRTGQLELQCLRNDVERALQAPVPAARPRWKTTRAAARKEVRAIVRDVRAELVRAISVAQAGTASPEDVVMRLAKTLDLLVGVEMAVDALRERGAR